MSYVYTFLFCCWFPFQDLLPDSLESLGRCWLRRLELQQRQSAEQRVLQARCLQVKGSSSLSLVGYVFSHGCCVFRLYYVYLEKLLLVCLRWYSWVWWNAVKSIGNRTSCGMVTVKWGCQKKLYSYRPWQVLRCWDSWSIFPKLYTKVAWWVCRGKSTSVTLVTKETTQEKPSSLWWCSLYNHSSSWFEIRKIAKYWFLGSWNLCS